MVALYSCFVFFFQAEDGIRDLVRSRGLGDVYKRQGERGRDDLIPAADAAGQQGQVQRRCTGGHAYAVAVSYTHLTLPTSDLV